MSRASDRPNTALLVIDVQNNVVAAAYERESVLANINRLVAEAREANAPVIWVQHADDDLPSGTPGWELAPELDPEDAETVVHKNFRSSFEGTELDAILADGDVGHVVVTGSQTDACVRWTLHGALERGYDTTLVADAHTTDDWPDPDMPTAKQQITHINRFWRTQATTGPATRVAPTNKISFN